MPRTIIFLAAVAFDSCLSGRTRRLAEALVAAGYRVVFVEMPSTRQVLRPWRLLPGSFMSAEGIHVVRLPPLPWRLRSASAGLTDAWARYVSRLLSKVVPDLSRALVATSTPWWLPVVRALPVSARCYDYLDHIDVQAGPSRLGLFQQWDDELLALSTVVTTVSEPLRKYLATRVEPDRVFLVPNGVRGSWIGANVAPVDRRSLTPRPDSPIAGFLGALFEWIDVDLIVETACRMSDIEFVVVGPTRRGVNVERLRSVPNIRCHGAVPFERVQATVSAFDVCLIPFKQDLVSEFADPLKVYEYCAMGKPVVSTVLFNASGPEPPIAVATTADAFARAIRAALAEPASHREERIAFARQHTWEARARQFALVTGAAADQARAS